MIDVRFKDKLFIAIAVPVIALGSYFFFWRLDAEKKIASLEERAATLVEKNRFDDEMRLADIRLEESRGALEAERSVPPTPGEVIAQNDSSAANRERDILNVFRMARITIIRSEVVEGASEESRTALENVFPMRNAICRKYVVDGSYPGVKKALDLFSSRKMAVIPERVEMREEALGSWILYVWQ